MADAINTPTTNQNKEALYSSVLRSKQQKARIDQLRAPQTENKEQQENLINEQNRRKQAHLKGSFSFSKPSVPENINQRETGQKKETLSDESQDKKQSDKQRNTRLSNKQASSQANKALTTAVPPQYKPFLATLSGNLSSPTTDISQVGKAQASIFLYSSLLSFTDFGASLIPLNLWMFGFLKRFLGPFQGPPFLPNKLAGQCIVILFTLIYTTAYFVLIVLLCLVVYFILNPEQAIIEFTYTFFQNIL